ncbi:3-mercaptopyruvate sulfurtransferase-like [Crassostrea virginica]
MSRFQSLVSTKWLFERISNSNKASKLRILDSTFHLPKAKRDAFGEFKQKHIPGAQFFSIVDCCDPDSQYEHMLPKPQDFAKYVGELGISNDTHVVVYDASDSYGFFSAQRAWWMFHVFGHEKVSVLNGGFKKWCEDEFPTTDIIEHVEKETLIPKLRSELLKRYEDIENNLSTKAFQIIDARGADRFNGTGPEPRPGIKPGHIPSAKNIPYGSVVDKNKGTLKSPEELKKIFHSVGVDLEQPLVASCGSGVSACVLSFAASTLGKTVPVYDGAWVEWYLRSTPEQRACCPEEDQE